MARTDYYGIQTPVLQATSQAIRSVNGTVGIIAPEDYPDLISAMHSSADYDNVMAQLIEETSSGAVVSFADGANNIPVKELIASIEPIQSGSGTPSPDNVRPISGRTSSTLTQNDGQTPPVIERTHTTDFGQTVFGAKLNHTTGVLRITNIQIQPTYVNSQGTDGGNYFYRRGLPDAGVNTASGGYLISNRWATATSHSLGSILITSNGTSLHFTPADQTLNTVDKMNEWLENNETIIVYELATPIEIQLTPTEVKTLLGGNTFFADSGDVEVTYRANGELYVQTH